MSNTARNLSRALIALAVTACVTKPESERLRSAPADGQSSAPPATAPLPAPAQATTPATTASLRAPAQTATPATTTRAWRTESSLGVEIQVPADWAVNDYGCNMSDKPSVVRGQGVQRMCFTPEKPTKQVALIEAEATAAKPAGTELTRRQLSLAGVSAERIEARHKDGRYLGWLRIPSRGVIVSVRVLEPELARRILDSAKLAPVDQHGCADVRPAAKRPLTKHPALASALSPAKPSSIAICYYGEHGNALQASARLTGQQAIELGAALNKTPAGPNPDADPKTCLHPPAPPPPSTVLLVDDAAGQAAVYVSFGGCVGRGLDNGARRAHVTASLVKSLMTPLGTGYSFNGDLPP